MVDIQFTIPTTNGQVQVGLAKGKSLFILGRNGTGKSALVHYIHGMCRHLAGGKIVYLPGSRPTYFDGDSLNMTANGRSQFEANILSWDASPDVRIRPISGTSRNERAIYDLQAAEVQYRVQAANEIELEGASSPAIARLQSKSSPLDRVNRLLQQANLPIRTVIASGELKAERGGSTYSISKMSDGERTALIMIADVVAAKTGSIFIIDEPELHLHRAIIAPLLSSLIAERPDCATIISTHELSLANDHSDSPVILVRGCNWSGNQPSNWEIELLPNSESVPEDLRIDLFGSRQIILFIEGTSTSRDQPMYATLFPKISIRHKSSCIDVRRAVVGLRQVEKYHHARAFGLVDNDGMDIVHQTKLISEGTYPLPVFAVESLYYCSEVISEVAARQSATLNCDPGTLIANAKARALSILRQAGKIEHLAARIAERQVRDRILESMPTRSEMLNSCNETINISIESPFPSTLQRLKNLVEANDLDAIIAGFPVRESGMLAEISQALRFIGDPDYEKAALAIISTDQNLATILKSKLGGLTAQLE